MASTRKSLPVTGAATILCDSEEWLVKFSSCGQHLHGRHKPTGFRLSGCVRFLLQGEDGEYPIRLAPKGHRWHLEIMDNTGHGQLYAQVSTQGPSLALAITPRSAGSRRGTLTFNGTARLRRDAFACRTDPPKQTEVVQVASGPADSTLNNSLFEIQHDTLVRFNSARTRITTRMLAGGASSWFEVQLEAPSYKPRSSCMSISIEEGFYHHRYAPWYRPINRKRLPTTPTGWMSWNTYFDQAGEEENLAEARVAAEQLKPYGLRIWLIESWQDNSPTQPCSQFSHLTLRPYHKQFPHGMKWLASELKKLGFIPGLWTVPFGTGDREFYEAHRQWFLHQPDGQPMSNWCGKYVLDPSQPAVRRHMTATHREMASWGYDFFKLDGMSGGPWYSAHFFEHADTVAAFRYQCDNPYELCVQALRKGLGEDRIMLTCGGHITGPEVTVVDGARIAGDVVGWKRTPKWENYQKQVRAILASLFAHNIMWYCDPDTLLVGSYAPTHIARLAATAIALTGQATLSGDKLAALPANRMWLLQRCLPVCDVRPLDLLPIYDMRRIWVLKVRKPFATWDVVSVFNFDSDTETPIELRFHELGLDPDKRYLVYDFWRQRLLGGFTGSTTVAVQPHANALLAIHEELARPQFISTDRHLTQGATCLSDLAWDSIRKILSGKTELVAGETTKLVFSVPSNFRVASFDVTGAKSGKVARRRDGTVIAQLTSPQSSLAAWRMSFSARRS